MTKSKLAALALVVLAVASCGDTERFRWGRSNQVQRHNENGAIAVPTYPVGRCGTVTITGTIDAQGTDISFAFAPTTPPPDGCCEAYGWIQHVTRGDHWTFDNGVAGTSGTSGTGLGATSDPYANPQGNPSSGDRWNPNPWYGDDANPRPQTTITDHPGGDDAFITQLVCVESGSVVFQYRWGQFRDRGSTQWRFIGGEGQNLTISL
ncbi:MAG TPA: hypothetical protein VM261_28905 [Kofleriaceae bacterium]|nr:hypothetical protein [Kofleriaceae bacterium]